LAARAAIRATPPAPRREPAATQAAFAPPRRRRTTAPLSAGLAAPAPSVAVPGSEVASASSGFQEQPRLTPALTTTLATTASVPVAVAAAPANTATAPMLANSLLASGKRPARRFTLRLPLGTAPALNATDAPALAANSWAPPALAATPTAWRLAADGTLLASTDGKVWTAWPATPATPVEAVAAAGPRVWIAGPGAALYVSADGGAHWARLAQLPNFAGPAAVIRSIEFDDALHGSLLTAAGRSWTTADGGHTWQPATNRGNLQRP
ncbi:MAG: WD40/YVTN/BNR-like repeat-containing protein, partial [Terriglobales bacterium]